MTPTNTLISGRYLQWLDAHAATLGIVLRDLADAQNRVYWRGKSTAAEVPCLLFADLLEKCADLTHNDAFGLDFAATLPARPEGVFHTILSHAGTLRDAFCAMCRLSSLMTGALSLTYVEEGASGAIDFTFPHEIAGKTQFVAGEIAIIALRVHELMGASCHPSRIEFTFPRPHTGDPYTHVLGEGVRYGRTRNRICYPLKLLHAPLQRDGRVSGQMAGAPHSAEKARTASRVATFLTGALQRGEATETNACRALAIGRRTLQRDLLLEGTSFRKLLESERRTSAEYYLTATPLSLSAVSALLGYSEQSAFSRACRSWFGKPPSAVRNAALRPAPTSSAQGTAA